MELATVQSGSVRQKTLKTAINCAGVGLHSGARTRVTLRPAPVGHGIEFKMARSRSGLKSLANVLQRWVAHLLGVRVKIAKLEIFDDCEVAIHMETGQW